MPFNTPLPKFGKARWVAGAQEQSVGAQQIFVEPLDIQQILFSELFEALKIPRTEIDAGFLIFVKQQSVSMGATDHRAPGVVAARAIWRQQAAERLVRVEI